MIRKIHIPGDIETLKEQFPALKNLKKVGITLLVDEEIKPGMIGKFDNCRMAKLANVPFCLNGVDKKIGCR